MAKKGLGYNTPKNGVFPEILLGILRNPLTAENRGESDHFLELLENLEILEILEIPPVKRPLRNDPFSVPECFGWGPKGLSRESLSVTALIVLQ